MKLRRRSGAGRGLAVLAVILMAVLALPPAFAAEPTAIRSIEAEATQFRLTLGDGRVLHSPELVGANLLVATLTGTARILIDAVERDPDAKSGEVWLHTLLVEQPDGTWANLCDAGPDGRRQGFPTASHMLPDGSVDVTPPERFELVCTAGVRGKCVRWGYRPWKSAELAIYGACTRMARADYCGDAVATTRNGTLIDMYDDRRIETPDNDPAQEFEAGWTSRGAVCVRHVRIKENISQERLLAACPRLAGKVGEMCTGDAARGLGAVLFNRSKP